MTGLYRSAGDKLLNIEESRWLPPKISSEELGDLVTISMSGARLIEKDGVRVHMDTTWPGYIEIRAIIYIAWKNLNAARWARTMGGWIRGWKNRI